MILTVAAECSLAEADFDARRAGINPFRHRIEPETGDPKGRPYGLFASSVADILQRHADAF